MADNKFNRDEAAIELVQIGAELANRLVGIETEKVAADQAINSRIAGVVDTLISAQLVSETARAKTAGVLSRHDTTLELLNRVAAKTKADRVDAAAGPVRLFTQDSNTKSAVASSADRQEQIRIAAHRAYDAALQAGR